MNARMLQKLLQLPPPHAGGHTFFDVFYFYNIFYFENGKWRTHIIEQQIKMMFFCYEIWLINGIGLRIQYRESATL